MDPFLIISLPFKVVYHFNHHIIITIPTWFNPVEQCECVVGGECSDVEVVDGGYDIGQRRQFVEVGRKQTETADLCGNVPETSKGKKELAYPKIENQI